MSKPRSIRAGIVTPTPNAIDSPAEPVVWTMLFSRIVAGRVRSDNAEERDRRARRPESTPTRSCRPRARGTATRRREDDAQDRPEQNGRPGQLGHLDIRGDVGPVDGAGQNRDPRSGSRPEGGVWTDISSPSKNEGTRASQAATSPPYTPSETPQRGYGGSRGPGTGRLPDLLGHGGRDAGPSSGSAGVRRGG